MNEQSNSAVIFYLAGYAISTVGAFACVALVREHNSAGVITSEANHISQWAGLGRRSPVLATVFTLFLLSFACIPATAGFTGKFAVFLAALDGGAADRKSTRLNSSHVAISYAVFCLKKKRVHH